MAWVGQKGSGFRGLFHLAESQCIISLLTIKGGDMQKTLLAGVLLLAISGCATEPMTTSVGALVPANRIFVAELAKPATGKASVVVKRDTGFMGGGCEFRLFVDGKPFADIGYGEKVQIHLQPGEHILGARSNGICMAGDAESATVLVAGQTRMYRIGIGSGGELRLQPTAF
jgi:hypothetical protein